MAKSTKKEYKMSKGYRLHLKTHELILTLSRMRNESLDTVLRRACSRYYNELKRNKIKK